MWHKTQLLHFADGMKVLKYYIYMYIYIPTIINENYCIIGAKGAH